MRFYIQAHARAEAGRQAGRRAVVQLCAGWGREVLFVVLWQAEEGCAERKRKRKFTGLSLVAGRVRFRDEVRFGRLGLRVSGRYVSATTEVVRRRWVR